MNVIPLVTGGISSSHDKRAGCVCRGQDRHGKAHDECRKRFHRGYQYPAIPPVTKDYLRTQFAVATPFPLLL